MELSNREELYRNRWLRIHYIKNTHGIEDTKVLWKLLRNAELKKETVAIKTAAQVKALRNNAVGAILDKTSNEDTRRLCKKIEETVDPLGQLL